MADMKRDVTYWRAAYEELVRQTGRDLNDGFGVDPRRTHTHPLAAAAAADKLKVAVDALMQARDALAEIVTKDIHHSGPNIDTDVMREGDISSTWLGDLGRVAKRARKAADQALAALTEGK